MTSAALDTAAAPLGLMVMGHFQQGHGSTVLLGADVTFWEILANAPEGRDKAPDPVDRYSTRVISDLATRFEANAHFPFGGPPYEPFIDWAKRSGRAWASPTGMLVHDTCGLMISYRGALAFDHVLDLPPARAPSPCETCVDRPCTTACPVGALSATTAYDVPACHAYLSTPAGQDCMTNGCAARRACPISQSFGRSLAQSAHHMRAFHPT